MDSIDAKNLVPIHTLWVGNRLGPSELLCLTSWLSFGHKVVLHTYDDLAVPFGVELYDASQLCPRENIFRNRNGSLAPFSDVYRALMLSSFPVLWLDLDIFLLRPFYFLATNILAREGMQGSNHINNAVMRLSPNHPILREILNRYKRPWTALPWGKPKKVWPVLTMAVTSFGLHAKHLPWGALGSLAIAKQISLAGFEGIILGPECSLTPHRLPLFSPVCDAKAALAHSLVYVHLYRSQVNVDLARPVPGSVYALLWDIVGFSESASRQKG